jgi:hypothetical protein
MSVSEQLPPATSDVLSDPGRCCASHRHWTLRKAATATMLCVTVFSLVLVVLRDTSFRHAGTAAFTTMPNMSVVRSERTVAEWNKFVAESLSINPLEKSETGFRILSWIEEPPVQEVAAPSRALRLRFGSLEPSDDRDGALERVGTDFSTVVHRAHPGIYRLEIVEEAGDGRKLALVIPVLHGRQTELVMHRDAKGVLQFNLYAPQALDPVARSAETLERLGGAQRDVVISEGHSARLRLNELAKPVVDDPIGATLAAYFLTIDRRPKELARAAADLTERFPELPDGYVLRGLAAEVAGDDQAALAAYRCALDRGLPVLLPFLDYLWDGIKAKRREPYQKIDLEKTRFGKLLREVRKSRVPYQLWSIWDLGVARDHELETATVR